MPGIVTHGAEGERANVAQVLRDETGYLQTFLERALLLGKPFVLPISLGPRVMRADTAAVAALALVNATIGDWRS